MLPWQTIGTSYHLFISLACENTLVFWPNANVRCLWVLSRDRSLINAANVQITYSGINSDICLEMFQLPARWFTPTLQPFAPPPPRVLGPCLHQVRRFWTKAITKAHVNAPHLFVIVSDCSLSSRALAERRQTLFSPVFTASSWNARAYLPGCFVGPHVFGKGACTD